MSAGLPSTILIVTDDVVADFVSRVFGPVASAVSGPLWIAVTLFVAIYGYMVMTGQIQHLYQSAFRNILVVGFVTYTALNWDWFSYLYETFTRSQDLFTAKVSLGRSERLVMDELYNRGMDTAFSIWSRSGWDLALWGVGAVVFVVTLALVAFAVFLLLLAKLLVALTLALGPIFVAFFLFESTRQWFKNWIGSLVTLVIFQLVVYGSLGLGYGIYQAVVPDGDLYTANAVDAGQLQGKVLPLMLIFLALLFVLRKADGHAMALVGSMSYVGDAASHVFREARYALSGARRYGPRLRLGRATIGAAKA
jgi:type IV secretion system protein VirB6